MGEHVPSEHQIECVAARFDLGYVDSGGLSVLEDLTGEYFPMPDQWRRWWKGRH